MDDYCAARSEIIPPLPWPTFAPPFSPGRADDPLPDCTRFAGPGTTTAIYMGTRQSARIAAALMARGLGGETEVKVCVDLSKPGQRLFTTRLDRLHDLVQGEGITGCALLLVTWPEARAAVGAIPVHAAAATTTSGPTPPKEDISLAS